MNDNYESSFPKKNVRNLTSSRAEFLINKS